MKEKKDKLHDGGKKRSKLQIELDDDKILELHLQKHSLREIGKKLKISHMTVQQRLDKILKVLGNKKAPKVEQVRNHLIAEHEAVKKKCWQLVNTKKEGFKFKYIELIIKANQEIARLQAAYPKEVVTPPTTKTFEQMAEEMGHEREAYQEPEEESEEEL